MTGNTTFDYLFNRFYKRIEKDEEFFNYYNVDVEEAIRLAHERAKGCLIDALDILPENFCSVEAIAEVVKKNGGKIE